MKRGVIIGITIAVILILLGIVLLYYEFFGSLTGNITGRVISSETKELFYSGKSAFMVVNCNPDASFDSLASSSGPLGGDNCEYNHYEWFNLDSLPDNIDISKAILTKQRRISGRVRIRIGRITQDWDGSYSYSFPAPAGVIKANYDNNLVFTDTESPLDDDLIIDIAPIVQYWVDNPGTNYGLSFTVDPDEKYEARKFYFSNADIYQPTLKIYYKIKSCKPKTCEELGKTCGAYDDKCGGEINCGECEQPVQESPKQEPKLNWFQKLIKRIISG